MTTVYEGAIYVSSPYGWRNHPITGARSHHNGKDMVGQTSKLQRLTVPKGVVLQVNTGACAGRGNNVVIQSAEDPVHPGRDVRLRYQHQGSTGLRVGQVLCEGDVVGIEGSTGDSTGSHCHFEVTVDGTAVDPSPWDGLPNAVGVYLCAEAAGGEVADAGAPSGGKGSAGTQGGGTAEGKTMVEVFTPGKDSRLEIFTRPDVCATVGGTGGTARWPEEDYVVYETAALAGISGVTGVLLRGRDNGLYWAAKLEGKYALRAVSLADAVAGGLFRALEETE